MTLQELEELEERELEFKRQDSILRNLVRYHYQDYFRNIYLNGNVYNTYEIHDLVICKETFEIMYLNWLNILDLSTSDSYATRLRNIDSIGYYLTDDQLDYIICCHHYKYYNIED